MTELIDWLRVQLDEDERVARAATAGPWWHNPGKVWLGPEAFEEYDRGKGEEFVGYGTSPYSGCIAATASHAQSMADAEHIARHDSARVLAEVDAKRRLLAEHEIVDAGEEWQHCRVCHNGYAHDAMRAPCPTLRMLALPYADRPGYRSEWAP